MNNISFAFFGTGPLAESVLASLVRAGYIPKLLVTKPDSKQGRHMELIAPHIKTWCEMKNIPVLQPIKLDSEFSNSLRPNVYDLFIVASYGKIIPEEILNLAKHGTLNVHPSLLPKYRGPSPIESALLDGEKEVGISIMKLDKEMDHGPILAQTKFLIDKEATAGTLKVTCGQLGGELLTQIIPHFIDGTLIPKEQDHSKATFCKIIGKELGEIKLEDNALIVRNKFRALSPWPLLYFFIKHNERNLRVKITKIDLVSEIENNDTSEKIILSVIPEGKKEINFESFKRGYIN